MKVEKILEYQELDKELYNIQKQEKLNENKVKAKEFYQSYTQSKESCAEFEKKAEALLADIEKIKKQYQQQEDKLNEFMGKNLESMAKEEISKINQLKDKLSQNIVILEKNLSALASKMNAILSGHNRAYKTLTESKQEYEKCKQAYDEDVKAYEKEKEEFSKKLQVLEKDIEPKIMEAYKKVRNNNLFPVVVPLSGSMCGRCRVELPFANIEKLNEQGTIICEHCGRIIYKA